MNQQDTSYRADIDGLRAIAVLAVIAFHMPSNFLKYGFLGVDVFFVISGFLITQIIWGEMQAGKFSVLTFYDRRLRRIMPALLAVIIVSTTVATLILLPHDLIGFAKSVLATLVFAGNIYFWRDTNYFSQAAEEKPLLHLWSLGVEEQFYLLFPFLLIFLTRYRPSIVLPIVIGLTAASFLVNIGLNSIGGQNPAFFLLPSRAWELGVGSVIALLPKQFQPNRQLSIVAGPLGLTAIVAALFFGNTIVLSYMPDASLAVVGAALVIWSGLREPASLPIRFVLGSGPMVWVGQLSYSLYLWHWPIIVFSQYYLVRALSVTESVIALTLMFLLAWASFRFLEQPIRNRKLGFKKTFATTSGISVAIGSAALAILVNLGLPQRFSVEASALNQAVGTNYRCPTWSYTPFGASRACAEYLNSESAQESQVVLFGNSHAQMYAPLVGEVTNKFSRSLLLVPMNGCLPSVTINISHNCREAAQENLNEILKMPNLEVVVIGTTWEHRELVDMNGSIIEPEVETLAVTNAIIDLANTIEESGAKVVVIGPLPLPDGEIASVLSRQLAFGWEPTLRSRLSKEVFDSTFAYTFLRLEDRLAGRFIQPHRAMCDSRDCSFVIEGRSLFADSNHLAQGELERFKREFSRGISCSFSLSLAECASPSLMLPP